TGGAEWLLMLFPYLFGAHSGSLFAVGPWDIFVAVRAWEHAGYVGILPLALAIVAIGHLAELTVMRTPSPSPTPMATTATAEEASAARHRWYSLLFLVLLLITGTVVAAGSHTPVSQLVYRTPVLGSLRAVERSFVLASCALALLAGFGLQRIIDS